ncbi:uncharacterized protein LOC126856006 [Cataglyphis hispanica]|uniref:uncharacterized protein LOC126856006 n=1 Tax=Cataglyphis hispanica TaxID=1086592 RepID=UPI00217F9EB1|nr:uncharacterized protein LOC126856006 [Cataglyphis hispanica]
MAAAKKVSSERKKLTDFVKSTHVCDINKSGLKTDFDRRNDQRYLLLSTTYELNASYTKKIHVGLQATSENCFVPIVKLTGNYADGICLDTDTWQQFQISMEQMKQYLCENQKSKPSPIIINNISIGFTTAYGTRAVIVSYKENAGQPANNNETEEQPPLKKQKTYSVAIVMQKTTFVGLEDIARCVDAHLARLIPITDTVNECSKYLINEIELKLPSSYVDCEIIKLTIRGNFEEIERDVRTQINNLPFLDVYFNIVFEELLSLGFNEIVRIILLKRNC